MNDHPKHYCGVFGIYGHQDAAMLTYFGLYALQHRGQESAGIVTCDDEKQFRVHRAMGLLSQVFTEHTLGMLRGKSAIGHTRYSTTGSSMIDNAQPLTADCACGQIAIAHNGNLVNAAALRSELEAKGSIFQTTVDSEIVLHLMASPSPRRVETLVQTMRRIQGAYSFVILTENELIGVRDPHGFRPLSIGMVDGAYVLASETCAFDLIHASFVRDVEPGEIVIIDQNGLRSIKFMPGPQREAFCMFEYVYFARPDSNIAGRNVHKVRVEMGRQLWREHKQEADIVVPIPDSGNCAALGYSLESGIPFEMAFVRNHYIGRSFIQPSQRIRELNVRVKLNLIPELIRGKRVIIVDDSIVRGNTVRNHVNTLKEAGAREVHVMISCPPHRFACPYGIDFPDPKELMANQRTLDGIREFLNADSLGYLSKEGMVKATGRNMNEFCLACFDGQYPVPYDPKLSKDIMESRRKHVQSIGESLMQEEMQIHFDLKGHSNHDGA